MFSSLRRFSLAVPVALTALVIAPPAHAIIGGERDTSEPGVVSVLIQHATNPTPETSFQCSGTLVSPHVVLTAAHCVHEKFVGTGQSFYAFFGDDANASDQLAKKSNFGYSKSVVIHPAFDASSVPAGGPSLTGTSAPAHDLALIVLIDKAPGTPRPLQRAPLTKDAIGRDVHAFGYGETVAGNIDSSGQRYSMTTKITDVTDANVVFEPTASLCEGDSGGPSFLLGDDGVARLAGVHSFVEHATSCTGQNFDARVDIDVAWVDETISSSDPGFSAEPQTNDTPAPGADGPTDPPASAPAPASTTTSGCQMASDGANDRAYFGQLSLALLAVVCLRRHGSRRGISRY